MLRQKIFGEIEEQTIIWIYLISDVEFQCLDHDFMDDTSHLTL
jgi:hypothetical protein